MAEVLLTPVGLDAGSWDWLGATCAGSVRHEYPGHGRRSGDTEPFTMSTLVEDVLASHHGPLDLVGVSLGGMVAQQIAVNHPTRVRSMLLASTGASASPKLMAQRVQEIEQEGMEVAVETTVNRWFTARALAPDNKHHAVDYVERTLRRLSPGVFANCWTAISGHDVERNLAAVRVPTTCVAGTADISAPPKRVRRIAELVPGARYVEFNGPHMLHMECADEFAEVLDAHRAWAEAFAAGA